MNQKIFKFRGQVQYYEWGGYEYIPDLLGFDNAQHKPCAEYWMGAHPAASGSLETSSGWKSFLALIKENPVEYLGEKVVEKFGGLPYLLKVLDVRKMLSIQVHPCKEEAEKGFAAEDAAGIPIGAKHRNYKDSNHKPEVMIALGDFWLLHGFKNEVALSDILRSTKEFDGLEQIFNEDGYYGLYKHVMEMPQAESDAMLSPLIQREAATTHSKDEPGFWVNKLYDNELPKSNIDRGIFSIYFFNLVHLLQGEGIFQAAGVPHAYLEGQNVELMANSDNVLRGGLTSKHVDVPELLKHIVFEGIEPHILSPQLDMAEENVYKMPVVDFGISSINFGSGREYVNESISPEIFLIMEGEISCDKINCKRGEVLVILPRTEYTIRAVKSAMLYKAYVPA